MAASMNKVILVGRMGQDAKLSYTTSGQAVANFSLATDEGYRDRQSGQFVERTEWHRIVAWRQSAEFAANYLGKGRMVLVEGKLQTRKWQDQNGQERFTTEIIADRLQGLDRAGEGAQQGQQGGYQQQNGGYQQQQGGYQKRGSGQQQQGGYQQGGGYPQGQQGYSNEPDEDLGPAFPSEASGMDDVPF